MVCAIRRQTSKSRTGGRFICAAVATGLLLTGCATWPWSKIPVENVVSLHRLDRADMGSTRLIKSVQAPDGRVRHVRAVPLLSSRNFTRITVTTTRDGHPALLATLDEHGRMLLMHLCAELAGDGVAVLVDGLYRFSMQMPRQALAERSLLIPGPWDAAEATAIANASENNYQRLNE
jgi:hypothetical protein